MINGKDSSKLQNAITPYLNKKIELFEIEIEIEIGVSSQAAIIIYLCMSLFNTFVGRTLVRLSYLLSTFSYQSFP